MALMQQIKFLSKKLINCGKRYAGGKECITFIRDKNSKGQEISGYIDYALHLKTEQFEPYFERKKKLLPKSSDLSYYNWEIQTSTSNSTPNFQVIADSETGLLFKNKRDRKVVNVDPKAGMRNLTRLAEAQARDSDGHTVAAVLKAYVDCFLSQTDTIPLILNDTRGVYLLFFDGGSRGNPGPGGTGSIIVRVHKDSHTASLIWAASMAYSRKDTTNNFA
ncbi:Pyruvate kinase, partial [Globisporangium splendens]